MDTAFSSVVEEEPEHEVGALTSMCAVEQVGNSGLNEICTVEEIRRLKIGVDSGAASSLWRRDLCKYYSTQKTEKTGTKYATATVITLDTPPLSKTRFLLVFFHLSQVDGWPRPRPDARVLTRFSTDSLPDLSRRHGESFVGVSVFQPRE